jgi:hypothetical protein
MGSVQTYFVRNITQIPMHPVYRETKRKFPSFIVVVRFHRMVRCNAQAHNVSKALTKPPAIQTELESLEFIKPTRSARVAATNS